MNLKMRMMVVLTVKHSIKVSLLVYIFLSLISCGKFQRNQQFINSSNTNKKIDSIFELDVNLGSQIKLIDLNASGLPINGKIYDFFEKDIINLISYNFDDQIYSEYLVSKFGDTIMEFNSKYLFDLKMFKKVDDVDAYFEFLKTLDFDEDYYLKIMYSTNLKTLIILENAKEIFKIDLILENNKLVREDLYHNMILDEQTFYNNNGYIIKLILKSYSPDLIHFYLYE